jgi:hypothetical protein
MVHLAGSFSRPRRRRSTGRDDAPAAVKHALLAMIPVAGFLVPVPSLGTSYSAFSGTIRNRAGCPPIRAAIGWRSPYPITLLII